MGMGGKKSQARASCTFVCSKMVQYPQNCFPQSTANASHLFPSPVAAFYQLCPYKTVLFRREIMKIKPFLIITLQRRTIKSCTSENLLIRAIMLLSFLSHLFMRTVITFNLESFISMA